MLRFPIPENALLESHPVSACATGSTSEMLCPISELTACIGMKRFLFFTPVLK